MLRVHFHAEDLARTKIAERPDPLWEIVLSLHQLRANRRDPALAPWRRHAARHGPGPLGMLLPLVPERGYFPDFLTPSASTAGLGHGLEAVLSTPRRRIRTELTKLAAGNAVPTWTRTLAEGEPAALRRLAGALRAYHDAALAPAWPWISARVEADRSLRTHTQWRAGADAMLRTLGPPFRWQPPVLEAAYPVDRDLRLDGRGLLLVPSYFCRRTPVVLEDTTLAPVLVYPVETVRSVPNEDRCGTAVLVPQRREHLDQLLGRTRAGVLDALFEDCTTTELARRAGLAVSSASEHATVLRQAGLVSTVRIRNSVRHTLTPLGLALLGGAQGSVRDAA
ncbi:ArsR family transcriptional regulator [Streptomyces armeniacus]|uniref:ArsR family transcriptional regulator n=1 Tax=Streptomyces armeniacus TaxID=83291 RepID=A0A345XZN7_9ACTN|nr:winged helix-turn-helix domain-containing protein [Streptomyces armeniacus]AXK37103.1 ArsR family transcriptional regulator [Streptomyces armeniacus]